ncbi:MAG: alpha-amylase family glycosyl hydrolase [Anaerolineales bacterium]|nr:alpha-amylase family glycosyl hydrolase [Anaerolineales bacterium]
MSKRTDSQMEFHISRDARDRYQFDLSLYSLNGNVIFADFHAVRVFAQKINQKRDLVHYPEQAVKAGQVNAMGLIDEILHYVIELYRNRKVSDLMNLALEWLDNSIGSDEVDKAISLFLDEFPPVKVYRHETDEENYLRSDTNGIPNRQIALEELILLWLENVNPAFSPFLELFNDENLERNSAYLEIISHLNEFFATQPSFGPEDQNLLELLRSPAIAVPHSLPGQLEYIRRHWSYLLGDYLFQLLRSLDLIEEEGRAIFSGAGPAVVYDFTGLGIEEDRFSPDKDWMPSVVLLAKNIYVWLDQLSKKYQRHITRLDQIPGEELETQARWGFTGLWLIGLWERSPASKTIKQMRGNPEAVASAYSLSEYQIAKDLGGEEAYQILRDSAWSFGIRLSSDMVPNHMGIDSKWVLDHPDWFISLDYSPFPSYEFNGPNLSWEDHVGIYLEDHYYDSSDAAVVFKRVDHRTGDSKFIYHGNDGTSMPWNDTAQLNYLLPDVREAVIQTILHVARKFPIIRFDAAMTLAKKHYQRLWFPEPGMGGAIPSRAEHGLTKEQFNLFFPIEFWREVVDRVAKEVPDTLLLAEAFWLMEGYFVRTLGMHRVYNSAFMNMMRDEKNLEYRLVIKNTLEFDPEILKRYVNFMNNPDERTAIDQFGNRDKYFGICVMMATMPGLPMFGHGQIEGYSEKYGMEFRQAYWSEEPDQNLVERHEREIFPILRRRKLFAEVSDFLLYDFYSPEGTVNEDIFAYSNRVGDEKALVVYHNKYSSARGWIRSSAAYSDKHASGHGNSSERVLRRKNLGEGLRLHNDESYFTIFRDFITGLEFIRPSKQIFDNGFYVELGAYKCKVFWDFYEVQDNEWHQYGQLVDYLQGRGVLDIQETLKEIFLQPVHYPFRELINPGMLNFILDSRLKGPYEQVSQGVLDEVEQKSNALLLEVKTLVQPGEEGEVIEEITMEIRRKIDAILRIPVFADRYAKWQSNELLGIVEKIETILDDEIYSWIILFVWSFIHALGKVVSVENSDERSRSWIDEWLFGKIIASTVQDLGLSEDTAWRAVAVIKWLTSHQNWMSIQPQDNNRANDVLLSLLDDSEIQKFLLINRYQDVLWFNKGAFNSMLDWMMVLSVVSITSNPDLDGDGVVEQLLMDYGVIQTLKDAEGVSGYQLEKLIEAINSNN